VRWLFPHTRGGAIGRFLLAAVIVVMFSAATTAVAGLLQIKQYVAYISLSKSIHNARVVIAHPGAPQTLLLIGSDHRAGEPFRYSNTDTMMLVRLDASSSTINVLSIPRDLKVLLPEGGVMATGKLNAAYSIGGDNLIIKTLQQQVFPGLKVNHIIDVNFGGFEAMVNAIGCVYTDVDRRYFHITGPGLENWSSIDIQPGYHRLCGADALSFVRFRHFDSDLVRNARQQDFLRWAKSQFSTSILLDKADQLLKLFGQHAQTDHDLHTTDGLLNLFNLVVFSAGHTVKQIKFPAYLQACGAGGQACYVISNSFQEQQAYTQFMTPTIPRASTSTSGGAKHGPSHHGPPPPAPVMTDHVDGSAQAHLLGTAGMPIYYPAKIANGSQYCVNGMCDSGPVEDSYPRAYRIQDERGHWHAAYRMTLVLNSLLGQYYGIQGMTWQNPPILNGPHQTQTVAGKQLLEYFNGPKMVLVAWRTPTGLYWVSNTLTSDLSNAQMVAIAASLTRG